MAIRNTGVSYTPDQCTTTIENTNSGDGYRTVTVAFLRRTGTNSFEVFGNAGADVPNGGSRTVSVDRLGSNGVRLQVQAY